MNQEINETLSLIRHNLEILKVDLKREPARLTCSQRAENCLALLEIMERQMIEAAQ